MKFTSHSDDTCRSADLHVNVSLPFDSVSISAHLHTESIPSDCFLSLAEQESPALEQGSSDEK